MSVDSLQAYLRSAHITAVGQLMAMTDDELLSLRNVGCRSLSEIREQLVAKGFARLDEMDDPLN